MDYLTNQDLDYFESQSQGKINLMIAGMTSLMSENDTKIESLEKQDWFQRMANTITGKNKMTLDEISANTSKINGYMTEAISSLYDREKLNQDIMLSLGNKVNELYANQLDLKIMLGAFVNKLNQKIESIDNFHMLIEEINQKVYSSQHKITAVCMIGSQLDSRTVHDDRKMDILKRAMQEAAILTDEEVKFSDFLVELLNVQEADAGVIALFLDCMGDDYTCEITKKVLQSYFFLPEKIRKMKNKTAFVESALNENDIDLDYTISTQEYFESLFEQLVNNVAIAYIEDYSVKKEQIEDYIYELVEALEESKRIFECAKPYNIIFSKQGRELYYKFFCNMRDKLSNNGTMGIKIRENLGNIEMFIRLILKKYPDLLKYIDVDGNKHILKFKDGMLPLDIEKDENGNKIRDIYMTPLQAFENDYKRVFLDSNFAKWDYYSNMNNCSSFYEWWGDYEQSGEFSYIQTIFDRIKIGEYLSDDFYNLIYDNILLFKNDATNSDIDYIMQIMEGCPICALHKNVSEEKTYRNFDDTPYIEVDIIDDSNNTSVDNKGYCYGLRSLTNAKRNKKYRIRVLLVGFDSKYTISYKILENKAPGVSNGKGFDVKWDGWFDDSDPKGEGGRATDLILTPTGQGKYCGDISVKFYISKPEDLEGVNTTIAYVTIYNMFDRMRAAFDL